MALGGQAFQQSFDFIAPLPPARPVGEATTLLFFPTPPTPWPERPETQQPSSEGGSACGSKIWAQRLPELKTLWDMGLSHGAIAKVMDLGKGAVSAKLDRLGWHRPEPVVDGRTFATQRPRPAKFFQEHVGHLTTLESTTGCRWPTGYASGEHLFCDEPKASGSYCGIHGARSIRGPA